MGDCLLAILIRNVGDDLCCLEGIVVTILPGLSIFIVFLGLLVIFFLGRAFLPICGVMFFGFMVIRLLLLYLTSLI